MKLIYIQLMILLLPLHALYAVEDAPPPITVTYSHSDTAADAPTPVVIPWESGLEIGKAIATAGGFSNPPNREIYLIRNGTSTRIPLKIIEDETPFPLQPGDRIEIK
jgi:hypothetical protein